MLVDEIVPEKIYLCEDFIKELAALYADNIMLEPT